MFTRGLDCEETLEAKGNIAICRLSPLKISATRSMPRASSESVTTTRLKGLPELGGVSVVRTPALPNSSSNRDRILDQPVGGSMVRFWNSSKTMDCRGSRDEMRSAICVAAVWF
jgi:hypothetical protein